MVPHGDILVSPTIARTAGRRQTTARLGIRGIGSGVAILLTPATSRTSEMPTAFAVRACVRGMGNYLPCMPTPLPRRNRWMLSLSCQTTTAFPKNETGRLPHLSFSRPAQRSLTFRLAWSLSHLKVTRYTRVLQRICLLLHRPGCFRPSDRLARWVSHLLKIADFHGILLNRT